MLSASPEYFRPEYDRNDPKGFGKFDQEKLDQWRDESLKWLQKRYKGTLVDVTLHLDERTPHMHAVVVPLVHQTLKKRRTKDQIDAGVESETYTKLKWNRSAYFDRSKLYEMQESYGSELEHLGLQRGIPKKITKRNYKTTNDFQREQNASAGNPAKPHQKKHKHSSLSLTM